MVRQWHCTLLCCVLLCFVLCTLFIFNRLIILPSLYLTQLNTFKSRNSCQWLCIKCVSQWFCVHSLSLYVFVHCFKVSFLNYVTLYVWPFQMLHGCSPFLWFCKIENRWDFQFFKSNTLNGFCYSCRFEITYLHMCVQLDNPLCMQWLNDS